MYIIVLISKRIVKERSFFETYNISQSSRSSCHSMLIFSLLSLRWLLPDFPLTPDFYPTAFCLGWSLPHDLGSPYCNQRALPLIFQFPSFIFPFTSYFLLQQRSTFPFARVDLRQPFRSPTSAPSTFTTADRFRFRNFLSSSFSVLLPTLPSFYRRGYSPEWVLFSCAPPLRFVPTTRRDVPRRALTRESMSSTVLRHVSQCGCV